MKIALSVMVPVDEIDGTDRYWEVSDAYNSGTESHLQVRLSTSNFTATLYYGASAVSDAVYKVYGF